METFFIGYLIGCISIIAVWIFFNARGKGSSTESLNGRIGANNISTERGLGSLKTNNTKSGKVIDGAKDIASAGVRTIEDTEKTVSSIIADATGTGKEKPKG